MNDGNISAIDFGRSAQAELRDPHADPKFTASPMALS
jgi:hypothetical protein